MILNFKNIFLKFRTDFPHKQSFSFHLRKDISKFKKLLNIHIHIIFLQGLIIELRLQIHKHQIDFQDLSIKIIVFQIGLAETNLSTETEIVNAGSETQ